jgi:hypothetical protein
MESAQFGEAIMVKGKFVPVPKHHAVLPSRVGGSKAPRIIDFAPEADVITLTLVLNTTTRMCVMENQQLLLGISNSWKGMLCIGLNGKFLRFRRDGVSISYTVICLSHFDVCLAIT